MYESTQAWRDVDAYFVESLVHEDDGLMSARLTARSAGLPPAEVSASQGKFLALVCEMIRARRVLEFGTLGGYSTIWFAHAVGPTGRVTTFEIDQEYASIAQENFRRAGVADRIELVVGPAERSVRRVVAAGGDPYDLVFIDADKPNNPAYLAAAMTLVRPGSVIIVDNVVRDGAVTDPSSADDRVQGTRAVVELMGADRRLSATALQTVGSKGWDGFSLAVVR